MSGEQSKTKLSHEICDTKLLHGWWLVDEGDTILSKGVDVCKWECVDDQFNYIFAVGWTAAAVVAGRLHGMIPHMTCEMEFWWFYTGFRQVFYVTNIGT